MSTKKAKRKCRCVSMMHRTISIVQYIVLQRLGEGKENYGVAVVCTSEMHVHGSDY